MSQKNIFEFFKRSQKSDKNDKNEPDTKKFKKNDESSNSPSTSGVSLDNNYSETNQNINLDNIESTQDLNLHLTEELDSDLNLHLTEELDTQDLGLHLTEGLENNDDNDNFHINESSENEIEITQDKPEIVVESSNVTADFNQNPNSFQDKITFISELESPHHPPLSHEFKFTKFKDNKKGRAQHSYFQEWPWLHYDYENDAVFCYNCIKAYKKKLIISHKNASQSSFISGYRNWRKIGKNCKQHQDSQFHKDSVASLLRISKPKFDVGAQLSKEFAQEIAKNQKCLLEILHTVRLLARQSQSFRNGNDEMESNFQQYLKNQARHIPELTEWILKKTNKYTSHDIQNEMIEIMSNSILRKVVESIKSADFYCMMSDETTDISKKEQMVFVVRWISDTFDIHESCLGLYECERTTAEHIVKLIMDIHTRFSIDIDKCRGQNYDGAEVMKGHLSGNILENTYFTMYTKYYVSNN